MTRQNHKKLRIIIKLPLKKVNDTWAQDIRNTNREQGIGGMERQSTQIRQTNNKQTIKREPMEKKRKISETPSLKEGERERLDIYAWKHEKMQIANKSQR